MEACESGRKILGGLNTISLSRSTKRFSRSVVQSMRACPKDNKPRSHIEIDCNLFEAPSNQATAIKKPPEIVLDCHRVLINAIRKQNNRSTCGQETAFFEYPNPQSRQ